MKNMKVQYMLNQLYLNVEFNEAVNKLILEILDNEVMTPARLIKKLQEKGCRIFTLENLSPHLKNVSTYNYIHDELGKIPILYTNVKQTEIEEKFKSCDIPLPELIVEQLASKMFTYSHLEIISLLATGFYTLKQIQYYLTDAQSEDGVRGRITELVNAGIVKRYYFSHCNIETEEVTQVVYHYLTPYRNLTLKEINTVFDKSDKYVKVYQGDKYEHQIFNLLSTRPMTVLELSELIGLSEQQTLKILREYDSDDKIKLLYQSYLSDGKNGKFLVALPDKLDELYKIYTELRTLFTSPDSKLLRFEIEKPLEIFTFSDFVEEMNVSETIAVAYLTHLRKRGILEQDGDDVVFGTFMFN